MIWEYLTFPFSQKVFLSVPSWLEKEKQPSWLGKKEQLFAKWKCSKTIILLFFMVVELIYVDFTTFWKICRGVPFDICKSIVIVMNTLIGLHARWIQCNVVLSVYRIKRIIFSRIKASIYYSFFFWAMLNDRCSYNTYKKSISRTFEPVVIHLRMLCYRQRQI